MTQESIKRKAQSHSKDETRPSKKQRAASKSSQPRKRKKPQLPRPKQPVTFALPKGLIQDQLPTRTTTTSSGEQIDRSRSSTPVQTSPLLRLHKINILLTAIHRRNKNQHRNQPFYRHLSFLRRGVKNLVSVHERSTALTHSSSTPSKPSSTPATAADIRQRFEREAQLRSHRESLEERIRETIVPGAYVAFSGLVADTQFANLGVVLLGVLADVVGVVGAMRRVERVEQGVVKRNVKRVEDSVGGTLVGVSTLVTGPDQGEVVERVYDSDYGADVSRKTISGAVKERKGTSDDVDLGEVVSRDQQEVQEPRGNSYDSRRATSKLRIDHDEVPYTDTTEQDAGKSTDTQDFNSTPVQRSHTKSNSRSTSPNPPFSIIGTSTAQPTKSNQRSTPTRPRANLQPSFKPTPTFASTSPSPSPLTTYSTKPTDEPSSTVSKSSQGKTKVKTTTNPSAAIVTPLPSKQKQKKTKKKGNAIDDLFSGFG